MVTPPALPPAAPASARPPTCALCALPRPTAKTCTPDASRVGKTLESFWAYSQLLRSAKCVKKGTTTLVPGVACAGTPGAGSFLMHRDGGDECRLPEWLVCGPCGPCAQCVGDHRAVFCVPPATTIAEAPALQCSRSILRRFRADSSPAPP